MIEEQAGKNARRTTTPTSVSSSFFNVALLAGLLCMCSRSTTHSTLTDQFSPHSRSADHTKCVHRLLNVGACITSCAFGFFLKAERDGRPQCTSLPYASVGNSAVCSGFREPLRWPSSLVDAVSAHHPRRVFGTNFAGLRTSWDRVFLCSNC